MELRVYESKSNRIKVFKLSDKRFSVCLYSDKSWIDAMGINAESFDDALDQFKIEIVKSCPLIGYLVYDIH